MPKFHPGNSRLVLGNLESRRTRSTCLQSVVQHNHGINLANESIDVEWPDGYGLRVKRNLNLLLTNALLLRSAAAGF